PALLRPLARRSAFSVPARANEPGIERVKAQYALTRKTSMPGASRTADTGIKWQVCPLRFVSMEGFTPFRCAQSVPGSGCTGSAMPLRVRTLPLTGDVRLSLMRAAQREHVELLTVDNRYQPKIALRSADYLIRERVDLAIEFQTDELIVPAIASK